MVTMKKQAPIDKESPDERPDDDSVERALAEMGDRWSFLILREAFFGERRFDAFQRRLNAAPTVLTDRLKKLTSYGILERRAYSERPPRFEYYLTPKGLDLYPAIVLIMRWGDTWLSDKAGPPIELVHTVCGKHTKPVLVCDKCAEPITARTVRWRATKSKKSEARPVRK